MAYFVPYSECWSINTAHVAQSCELEIVDERVVDVVAVVVDDDDVVVVGVVVGVVLAVEVVVGVVLAVVVVVVVVGVVVDDEPGTAQFVTRRYCVTPAVS